VYAVTFPVFILVPFETCERTTKLTVGLIIESISYVLSIIPLFRSAPYICVIVWEHYCGFHRSRLNGVRYAFSV
jgi:hypothetical protein